MSDTKLGAMVFRGGLLTDISYALVDPRIRLE
jgi:ABC-type dipeptide/oligopeptide/nickel transport system permease component